MPGTIDRRARRKRALLHTHNWLHTYTSALCHQRTSPAVPRRPLLAPRGGARRARLLLLLAIGTSQLPSPQSSARPARSLRASVYAHNILVTPQHFAEHRPPLGPRMLLPSALSFLLLPCARCSLLFPRSLLLRRCVRCCRCCCSLFALLHSGGTLTIMPISSIMQTLIQPSLHRKCTRARCQPATHAHAARRTSKRASARRPGLALASFVGCLRRCRCRCCCPVAARRCCRVLRVPAAPSCRLCRVLLYARRCVRREREREIGAYRASSCTCHALV
jgi:hypothetical protein